MKRRPSPIEVSDTPGRSARKLLERIARRGEVARVREERREVAVGPGEAGALGERAAGELDGLGGPLGGKVREAHADVEVEREGIERRQAHRPLKADEAFLGLAEIDEAEAAAHPAPGEVGIERQRLVDEGDGIARRCRRAASSPSRGRSARSDRRRPSAVAISMSVWPSRALGRRGPWSRCRRPAGRAPRPRAPRRARSAAPSRAPARAG